MTPEQRSIQMGKIRGKNTKPETIVYRYLRNQKIYFQKHYRTKFGFVVDIALPRKKRVVFIDGDFWHGRTVGRLVERRGKEDFWTKKILRNVERDLEQAELMESEGWSIVRVWSSELMRVSTRESKLEEIGEFLLNGFRHQRAGESS